jgi:1,2-diacylglycerol 3-alpha-glucosyltransferase
MVMAEAMAAGTPVVAVDAPGVRDIVRDGENGRLLPEEDAEAFVAALDWLVDLPAAARQRLEQGVAQTARQFSMDRSAEAMLDLYDELIRTEPCQHKNNGPWTAARQRIEEEWKILHNIGQALGEALRSPQSTPPGGNQG